MMMMEDAADRWPLRCPVCGDQILIEAPDSMDKPVGTAECALGHVVLYQYDGETVALIEAVDED